MHILREQLNRLFLKKYGSGIFGGELPIRN
jgi:hypothetical protein